MKLKITLICLILISLTVACQRDDPNEPMNPDMARSMLRLKGYTADEAGFFQAVKNNDVVILKAFIDAGINPNGFNENGETLLTLAIQYAESKTVKALIEKVDINLKDKKGNSPIHLALLKNKDDALNALLEKGADVNVAGRDGKTENQTVLYLAVIRSRDDLVEQLLAKGANPNIADSGNATPLTEACVGATVKPAIVKMLLDKGANPNVQENLSGAHSLIWIASNKDISSSKRVEVAKMLLEKGADKSLKDKKGRTALDWAKQSENKDVVELLK
jgi:ankyrin repeat protein